MNGSDYDGDFLSTASTRLVDHKHGEVKCPKSLVQQLSLTLDWVEELHVHYAASSSHGGLTYLDSASGTIRLYARRPQDTRDLDLDAKAGVAANPCILSLTLDREFVYEQGGRGSVRPLALTLSVDLH